MKSSKKKSALQPAAEELFYLGFGLASLAKDQLESIFSVLVKEGKLLAKDQKQFKKDLTAKGRAFYKKMQNEMREMNKIMLKKKK